MLALAGGCFNGPLRYEVKWREALAHKCLRPSVIQQKKHFCTPEEQPETNRLFGVRKEVEQKKRKEKVGPTGSVLEWSVVSLS